MPVGPSQGASGHDANTFIVLTSSTCMVLVPSLLTKILPLPSLAAPEGDRKSTRLNSSHDQISYAVFCLKKKKVTLSTPRSYPSRRVADGHALPTLSCTPRTAKY